MKRVVTKRKPRMVITQDVYLRRPGIVDPIDELILVPGVPVVSIVEAEQRLRADGFTEDADAIAEQIPADPNAESRIYFTLGPGETDGFITRANETMRSFEAMAKELVTPKRAQAIRELRCDKRHSWRAVARACHGNWLGAKWEPCHNQLMGVALCERAAIVLGENHRVMPWNDF